MFAFHWVSHNRKYLRVSIVNAHFKSLDSDSEEQWKKNNNSMRKEERTAFEQFIFYYMHFFFEFLSYFYYYNNSCEVILRSHLYFIWFFFPTCFFASLSIWNRLAFTYIPTLQTFSFSSPFSFLNFNVSFNC